MRPWQHALRDSLGRKVLNELETLVTPDTLLRWHRERVASKWNYSHRLGAGRPRIMDTIADLIVRIALETRSWGNAIIRAWETDFRSPYPAAPYPITLSDSESASAEC
jgi:hypothetical protein